MNTATIASDTYVPVPAATAAPAAYASNATSPSSAASWGAIFAGAAAAAAFSLIMLILGIGLGLSAVSPWVQDGISAATFGVSTVAWVIFTQLVASGLGGYLAGRLRTKWVAVHTDEVYFRDTVHGFLAWAVATLLTASLLVSTTGSIVGKGAAAAAAATTGVAALPSATRSLGANANNGGPLNYFVDSLFRKNPAAPASGAADQGPAPTAEAARIFMNGMADAKLPSDDVRYLGGIVAQRTSLSQQDAEKRVTDAYANFQAKLNDTEMKAKDAADKARKAAADVALWVFIALLIGAFIASLAATFGGRRRDA